MLSPPLDKPYVQPAHHTGQNHSALQPPTKPKKRRGENQINELQRRTERGVRRRKGRGNRATSPRERRRKRRRKKKKTWTRRWITWRTNRPTLPKQRHRLRHQRRRHLGLRDAELLKVSRSLKSPFLDSWFLVKVNERTYIGKYV